MGDGTPGCLSRRQPGYVGTVAQLAERGTVNPLVTGSRPVRPPTSERRGPQPICSRFLVSSSQRVKRGYPNVALERICSCIAMKCSYLSSTASGLSLS